MAYTTLINLAKEEANKSELPPYEDMVPFFVLKRVWATLRRFFCFTWISLWETDSKNATEAFPWLHLYLGTVFFQDGFRERKPDAIAFLGCGIFGSVKRVKDVGQVFCGDAYAVVDNL